VKIDWSIRISDILTFLTIFVSVIALTISWSKDRYSREKEQADRVRAAMGKTLAKLDRWKIIQLSIFQELQPVFIETSEMLTKNYDVIEVRDYLWKNINSLRTLMAAKVLEEQIETAYVDLFSHFPAIRDIFLNTLIQLEACEAKILDSFIEATQDNVLSFEDKENVYTSAMLGNALRATAFEYSSRFKANVDQIMHPVKNFLFEAVVKSDKEILLRGIAHTNLNRGKANKSLHRNH
jgi:hypothetical protein